MKIIDLISREVIETDLKSREKEDMLEELVDLLVRGGAVSRNSKPQILDKLRERELLGSTGIGKGVAIPHAKCTRVKKMVAALGVSEEGVDFSSLDGDLTYIFFILIAPGETPGPHLKALARISRLLDDKFVRERIRSAGSSREIFKIIKDEEQKSPK
ncbi:MAG: PTS sugar transporter subunit IIA [Candidatus Omnitrophica bacterium]|nr:PTS sugar transporter subunit IIA [Candidatus Omnitrophota bacterium]